MISALLSFLLLHSVALAGESLTLRWNELQAAVANRQATVVLTDNRQYKGAISSVTDEALLMEQAPSGRVARQSIREIRVQKVKGPRRAIFTAGVGAGVALATLPWAISDSRVNVSDGARIAQWGGITTAATIAGYFIGRRLDAKETIIRIAGQ
ncbi:MAG: hypothetical protein JNL62_16475 [Bryobacterales bacterium]|nr:hypothetical protein [Bryobacterales bacterium]